MAESKKEICSRKRKPKSFPGSGKRKLKKKNNTTNTSKVVSAL